MAQLAFNPAQLPRMILEAVENPMASSFFLNGKTPGAIINRVCKAAKIPRDEEIETAIKYFLFRLVKLGKIQSINCEYCRPADAVNFTSLTGHQMAELLIPSYLKLCVMYHLKDKGTVLKEQVLAQICHDVGVNKSEKIIRNFNIAIKELLDAGKITRTKLIIAECVFEQEEKKDEQESEYGVEYCNTSKKYEIDSEVNPKKKRQKVVSSRDWWMQERGTNKDSILEAELGLSWGKKPPKETMQLVF